MAIAKNRLRYIPLLFLLLCCLLISVMACDPGFNITIENNTNQVLSIYLIIGKNPLAKQGILEPGGILKTHNIMLAYDYYGITAKNDQNETVYSKKFNYYELRDDYNFRVVISKLDDEFRSGENSTVGDNVSTRNNITER